MYPKPKPTKIAPGKQFVLSLLKKFPGVKPEIVRTAYPVSLGSEAGLFLFTSTGVKTLMRIPQFFIGDVSINLSRGNITVAQ